ncbi:MAG TPA: hypothetical protein VFI95_18155 [Terriglobales bacterium]|nr:hypothetical protein [Terriglobales bacterium]
MARFFTRERFGEPQFIAGLLLLGFLAQSVYLVWVDLRSGRINDAEIVRIERGLQQWHGGDPEKVALAVGSPTVLSEADPEMPFAARQHGLDPNHSPLYYLIASAPLVFWPGPLDASSMRWWGWPARAPYLLLGVLLGASLWYVARRLYGNSGGYIALALFCFSPGMIREAALWMTEPEMGAAWGAFGATFTAIAVAHTLYAPREVVLWNWRRITLLGIALALAVGSQYSLLILVPIVLALMLYLAPARRKAALVIWAAACAIGMALLLASWFFHFHRFFNGLRNAEFFPVTARALVMPDAYRQIFQQLGQSCPALLFALPIALVSYFAWRRTRYFGNTSPLMIAGLFLALGIATPHYPGLGFKFLALPFLFLFIAGIFADLLETRHRALVAAALWGLLASYGLWSVIELARVAVA